LSDDGRTQLQNIVREIREVLEPVAQAIGDEGIRREVLRALGLDPGAAGRPLNIPPSSIASINAYRDANADDADLKAFISTLQDITLVVQGLVDFVQAIAATDANAPPGFIAEEAVSFYLNVLTLGHIRNRYPGVYIALKLLRLIEEQSVRFGGFVDMFFKTGEFFEDVWGAAGELQTDEDAKKFSDIIFFIIGALAVRFLKGDIVYGYDAGPGSTSPLADAASNRTLTIGLKGSTQDSSGNTVTGSLVTSAVIIPRDFGGPGLLLRFDGNGGLEVPINKNLSFKITVDGPDFLVYLGDGLIFPSSTDAGISLSLNAKSTANQPILWPGNERESHIRIGKFLAGGSVAISDQSVKLELKESAFVLTTEAADGFLKTILDTITNGGRLEVEFDFNIGYSKKKGFFIGGGAGTLMSIPIHRSLGPLQFNTLTLGLSLGERAGKKPGFKLESSLSFGFDFGVLKASVDRIGLAGMIAFDDGEFSLNFKPPNGVGLAVNAGAVSGGGFLYFDYERDEYAGGLELDISGIITVKAIGIITTRMLEGFSLLIIITAEFGTPIQLGFGFTLIGIGGLFSLNRTIRLDMLAEGIRTGAADRIMFPQNIIANAARIISDLRTYFPPQQDTFLIGPMVKLGWGTPTLVSLSLGVIVQIPPGNITILGVLKVILPDEDAAVLKLQVAFIGSLEIDKERAWFFATLYDSRVLLMTLEGGMGVLVGWGATANFVISVGGFHPQFQPPPLPFPIPDRLAINILDQPFARIRVMAYFAVTSNMVQFGAKAELFFGFDSVRIEGHLAFDALFQFSPFYFIIEISASISLKVFGAGLFSVRLRGSLEGPTLWRIKGAASVSFLFFSIGVDVEETWGERRDTTLPDTSAMPLLTGEFQKESNWTAELPAGNRLLVSLRTLEASSDGLVLHPVGQLRISQRAVPLEVRVDKIGNQKTSDANKFRLKVDTADLVKRSDSDEMFALAQYQAIGDSEKFSLPAFQPIPGGVVLSSEGAQANTSRMVKRNVRYELIIIDNNFLRFVQPFFTFWASLFTHFFFGSSATQSVLSFKQQKQYQPFAEKVKVNPTGHTVARVQDNKPFAAESVAFGSEALAREYMQQQIAQNPKLARELHVIPQYEVNESV
jgi:hypothetical protein